MRLRAHDFSGPSARRRPNTPLALDEPLMRKRVPLIAVRPSLAFIESKTPRRTPSVRIARDRDWEYSLYSDLFWEVTYD